MTFLLAAAARNRVVANLLMVLLIVIGVTSLVQIRRELIPQFDLDRIRVQVVWKGASPEEVEENVCIKIEEALTGVEGIKKLRSNASDSLCTVIAEIETGVQDSRKVLDDIKDEVDQINTFPKEIERPVVTEVKQLFQVAYLSLWGEAPEISLKRMAEEVKDELLDIDGISQVKISGLRDWEISIEVSEATLRRHGLSFFGLADIIRKNVTELSGGDIRSPERRIRIRTLGKRYTGPEFESLEILARRDGTIVRLGEIARVVDGFEDSDKSGRFNGKPAALIGIFRTPEEDVIDIAEKARAYARQKETLLPGGLRLTYWADTSVFVKDRIDLLLRNGRLGLLLVFLCLWLFLSFRLSFWVAFGLPVALMSALGFVYFTGGTINMISLFAFIMVLGILVDDAIVVGENIYAHMSRGEPAIQAAIAGVTEVAVPVLGTVSTTIVAFVPLLMMEGIMGKFLSIMPIAIIAALIASLIEALFILPSHLAHWMKPATGASVGDGIRRGIENTVTFLINRAYLPVLRFAMEARYFVLAASVSVLLLTVSLAVGGHVRFLIFPKLDSDYLEAVFTFPQGTPIGQTTEAAMQLERAATALGEEFKTKTGEPLIRHIFSNIGEQVGPRGQTSGSHTAQVIIELLSSENRGVPSTAIVNRWRELAGEIPDVLRLNFQGQETGPGAGKPIEVQFTGPDIEVLRRAANELKAELAKYPGVYEIEDDYEPGKLELQSVLKPEARSLGVSVQDLAQQLRAGFYGLDVFELQRGRDDVTVKLRYPPEERSALGDVENMRIRTSSGAEIPFFDVANVSMERGVAEIKRIDRRKVVTVTADVYGAVANPTEILNGLGRSFLPGFNARFPGVRAGFEGQSADTRESVGSLLRGFVIAAAVIYFILAWIFRSYFQPIVVMSTIPFGIVGAIWGHIIMGFDISLLSMMGIVALAGVVVNNSLVFLDFVNRSIAGGKTVEEALRVSGASRFRPIILTTLTTVAGLGPMLFEKSFQAQFLIPMAVSLCFGLVAATAITLVLVPVTALIGNDIARLARRLLTGIWPTREEVDVHSPHPQESAA